jgi:hypothetical protein
LANAEFAIILDHANRFGFQTTRSRVEVVVRWISGNDNPFFDSDLASEWVGVYDDTPEPPGLLAPWGPLIGEAEA